MAQSNIVVTLSVSLPWWWRLYIGALIFLQRAQVLDVDANTAARFIARHMRVYATSKDGRRKRLDAAP